MALETIALLEEGLIDNAAERGEQALAGLRPLIAAARQLVHDVRGKGLMIGVQFDTGETAEAVQWACFERGLLVLEAGDDVVRMSPPLSWTRTTSTPACASSARRSRPLPRTPPPHIDEARKWENIDDGEVDG